MTDLKINGLEWKFFLVDGNDPKLADDNGGEPAYGITYFRDCEIYVDRTLQKPLVSKTITHEFVHAVAFSYGVDLDSLQEEEICDFVGAHFDELLKLRNTIYSAPDAP